MIEMEPASSGLTHTRKALPPSLPKQPSRRHWYDRSQEVIKPSKALLKERSKWCLLNYLISVAQSTSKSESGDEQSDA